MQDPDCASSKLFCTDGILRYCTLISPLLEGRQFLMTHPYAEESVFEIESYMSARKPEVRKRDWRRHCDIISSNLVKTPPHIKAKTRDQFS